MEFEEDSIKSRIEVEAGLCPRALSGGCGLACLVRTAIR